MLVRLSPFTCSSRRSRGLQLALAQRIGAASAVYAVLVHAVFLACDLVDVFVSQLALVVLRSPSRLGFVEVEMAG